MDKDLSITLSGGMHAYEWHRFIMEEIPSLDGKIVLDCGCGRGIWGYLMRSEVRGDNAYIVVGIDLYKPYLRFCRKYQVYDDLIVADIAHLPFKDKSIDMILAVAVLEHLSKDEGIKFLYEIQKICKEIIIIGTPNGMREQKAIDEPSTLEHKSAWFVADFKRRGYKVRGWGFKYHPKEPLIWGALRYICTPFAFVFPSISESLVATKVIDRSLEKGYKNLLQLANESEIRATVPKKVEVIKKYSRGRSLDCGCGDGNYMPYFDCETLVGVDILLLQLKRAKVRNKDVNLVMADARSLPFKDDTFDFVFCSQLIEHFDLTDGKKMLKEIERVTNSNGDIIVTTPNYNPFTRFIIRRFFGGITPEHITFYNIKKLELLGFKIIGFSIASEWCIKHTFLKYSLLRKIGDVFTHIFPFIGYALIAHKKPRTKMGCMMW